MKYESQDCTFKPQMVTNPNQQQHFRSQSQIVSKNPPINQIVLGEISMTTHHTEEDEVTGAPMIENDVLFLRKREDAVGSRERKNQDSAKIMEGQRKQLEKHVNRLAMTKVKKEFE